MRRGCQVESGKTSCGVRQWISWTLCLPSASVLVYRHRGLVQLFAKKKVQVEAYYETSILFNVAFLIAPHEAIESGPSLGSLATEYTFLIDASQVAITIGVERFWKGSFIISQGYRCSYCCIPVILWELWYFGTSVVAFQKV